MATVKNLATPPVACQYIKRSISSGMTCSVYRACVRASRAWPSGAVCGWPGSEAKKTSEFV
eukprot:17182-Lingulodinium_polyedra.AAC.1